MAKVISAADLVSLEEVKRDLRISHTDDDAQLASLIAAATVYMTEYLRAPVSNGTWRQEFAPGECVLELAAPAIDPVSVSYTDPDGAEQTLTGFTVVPGYDVSFVTMPDDDWPEAQTFVVDYGVSALENVEPLKAAATMHVRHMYQPHSSDPLADEMGMPKGYQMLVAGHRRF